MCHSKFVTQKLPNNQTWKPEKVPKKELEKKGQMFAVQRSRSFGGVKHDITYSSNNSNTNGRDTESGNDTGGSGESGADTNGRRTPKNEGGGLGGGRRTPNLGSLR